MEKNNNKNQIDNQEDNKSGIIRLINIVQFVGIIILAMYFATNDEKFYAIISIIVGIVLFVFVKGFADIIDLLDSINNKLDKE